MTSSPKPSRKLLAIAGALSVVAGSFAAVPATFAANVSASVPGGNSQNSAEECRHIAVSATQYQGLPGQYQLAYSAATSSLYTSFSSGRPPILTGGVGTWNVASTPSLATVYQSRPRTLLHVALPHRPVSRLNLPTVLPTTKQPDTYG